jgi:long-chain acyl-CoA synthetase
MIIGEGEKFPSALIVPNFTYVREWHKQQNHQKTTDSNESIASDQIVIDKIEKEIEIQNVTLGNWERVKKFRLLSSEFSIDGGELTPTLKLKRKVILEKYKQIIESIYTQ